MIAAVRNEEILRFIREHELCSIGELSKQFQVSNATVHRVLNDLDAEGQGRKVRGGVRFSEGGGLHEEYFGAKAAQTSTETFNAMDFGNPIYACPTIQVTSPTAKDAYDDDDDVKIDATLVWPGDAKSASRIAEVVIKDATGDKSFPLDASIEESGRFTGSFTAGDLGEGGPAGKWMRLILVFKDNTELETVVMTGAILAWKCRVYVTTTLGKPYEYYAFNTTYDCSYKAQVSGPITRIRDASSTFTNFQRYWMVDMALDDTPVAIKGVFNCKPVGEQQGAFDYPNNAKMTWRVDKVTHRVFDGTAYDYVPLTAATEFELKLAAGAKSQYLNIEVFQEWGAAVTGPVTLSSGGKQGIVSLVTDITRK